MADTSWEEDIARLLGAWDERSGANMRARPMQLAVRLPASA